MTPSCSRLLKGDAPFTDLVFAILERISVLYGQLQSSAIGGHGGSSSSRKVEHFIRCLREVFSSLVYLLTSYEACLVDESEKEKRYAELRSLYESVIQLSGEMAILPKQDVPVEIYRFLRIFNRDGIADQRGKPIQDVEAGEKSAASPQVSDEAKFVLYSGVDRGTFTYENHPLEKYEEETLEPALRKVYAEDYGGLDVAPDMAYHIGIPYDETNTPLSWPVLAHEVGHQVMKWALLDNKIEHTFFKGPERNEFIDAFMRQLSRITGGGEDHIDKHKVLGSWLNECWCDIYAYFATGPAILYAQRNSFVLQRNWHRDIGTATHPPYYLRLLVLDYIFSNHQTELSYSTQYGVAPLDSYLSELLIHDEGEVLDDIVEIAMWFASFFNDHFKMDDKDTENVKEHMSNLKLAAPVFDDKPLKHLVDRLNEGYPIPAMPTEGAFLEEKETSIYEIMLAAWISHDTVLRDEVANELFSRIDLLHQKDAEERWELFEKTISPSFERFNQAVLRSLQISEWVQLLKPKKNEEEGFAPKRVEAERSDECHSCAPVVLVDREIKQLIIEDQFKVIPLIDLETQLGSASLDVRLGPTFQTYQPNQSGVVDFTDSESVANVSLNSSIVDLDFKKGIVLAPGQFVLAHTMEYFGFPNSVAAQIEGRSSFARLGVQVHMTANLIDPGFHGSITFEIYNAGPNPIRLFPGYRIGQLRLFKCNAPDTSYDKKSNAKYKGQLIFSKSLVSGDYEVGCLKPNKDKQPQGSK